METHERQGAAVRSGNTRVAAPPTQGGEEAALLTVKDPDFVLLVQQIKVYSLLHKHKTLKLCRLALA